MAKIVFYSAQTGEHGFIPCIKDQMIDEFDYYFINDKHKDAVEGKGWKYMDISNDFLDFPDEKRQRIPKTIPRLFFPEADYTVYVDPRYYISRDFYKLCLEIIQEDKPDWMVPPHNTRFSFQEEVRDAIVRKKFPIDQINKIMKDLKEVDFYNTLCGWQIRKNNDKNHELGKKWFELIDKYYDIDVRDQLLLPAAVPKDYVSLNHSYKELENLTYLYNV
tara:strand:- start:887 stop:1543 length:657 start_codon:yes stop_codon:yes gene_type:complete